MVDKKTLPQKKTGHKGGEARIAKHNKEELSGQARKTAQTVEEKYPGFYYKTGSKKGIAKKEDSIEAIEHDDEYIEYPLEEEEFNSENQ